MRSTSKVRLAVLLFAMLLSSIGAFATETDDYIPEVTDRVARISYLHGDVQIRRADSQDWEVAVLNLPIVEGDEIATDGNGRLEIQLNSYTHVRIAENSHVRFLGLKDGGIALSVPLGTVVIRAAEFDGARAYFEIDAPKTTVSIQKPGTYRIEAGVPDSLEVIVSATDGGEARVYSADAGFTVKDGRRAKIYIDGSQSGEWETASAEDFSDEFDSWNMDRDAIIAQRLQNAHYDRYYDRDIYGADDLNDYGEWIHTRQYGYVWRPYQTSVSQYASWSPYRYGQWRWVPQYGWTWVNDEPWGWATYHYGRWVWDNGYWYWSPYGYYRNTRSWWHPALVVINVIGGNVCWYPLPYHYNYHDYNSGLYGRNGRRRNRNNQGGNPGGPVGGNPNPAPTAATPVGTSRIPNDKLNAPPFQNIPAGGVISVPASEFGRGKKFGPANPAIAKTMSSKAPSSTDSAPILPILGDLNGKLSPEIRTTRPPLVRAAPVRTGATVRTADAPLDQDLRKTRILGGRPPLQINTSQGEIKTDVNSGTGDVRRTGAVGRPTVPPDNGGNEPIRQAPPTRDSPIYVPPTTRQRDGQQEEPVRVPRNDPPMQRQPREEPVRPPRYDPPPVRNDPPPVRHDPPPRQDPPVRNDPPPRNDPPVKNDPPPTKSDPPPSESEPSKPSPPLERKGKDGR